MEGNRSNPSILFPLDGVDNSELDDLVRAILFKQGVTDESEIQAVIEKAEKDSEIRLKVYKARKEIRRLMLLKSQGAKIGDFIYFNGLQNPLQGPIKIWEIKYTGKEKYVEEYVQKRPPANITWKF